MAVPNFHREHFGDITPAEVETLIEVLTWTDQFQDLIAGMLNIPNTQSVPEAGILAEQLKHYRQRVRQREGLYALEKGQCETVVDDKRCEGIQGHDGDCPQPLMGKSDD